MLQTGMAPELRLMVSSRRQRLWGQVELRLQGGRSCSDRLGDGDCRVGRSCGGQKLQMAGGKEAVRRA